MTTANPPDVGDESFGSVELLAAVLALAFHGAIVLGSPRSRAVDVAPTRPPPIHVFDLEPIREPVVAEPEPPAVTEPAPRTRTADRSPRPTTPSDATPSNAAPSAAEPLDLSSMVVGGESGLDFGRTGDGTGSVGVGARVSTPSTGGGAVDASVARVARSAADLSVDVRPPDGLDRLLETFYPSTARAQGIAGSARVRLRFGVDGRVLGATVLSETPEGSSFGAACRRMLVEGPAWAPALDPAGAPIARVGRDFRCRFELR